MLCMSNFFHALITSGKATGIQGLAWSKNVFIQLLISELPSYLYTTALHRKPCKTADRVRSMCFNQRRSEIVVISSNGFIHCWDGLRLKLSRSFKPQWGSEYKTTVTIWIPDMIQILNGCLKTGQKMSVLWSKMFGIWMVCLAGSDHLKTGKKVFKKWNENLPYIEGEIWSTKPK